MLRPLHDQVLISPIAESDTTKGGLFVPENAKEKPTRGTVVAVGPGRRNKDGEYMPVDLKPGDTVLYPKYTGTEIDLNGETAIMINESAILAVLEDDPEPTNE